MTGRENGKKEEERGNYTNEKTWYCAYIYNNLCHKVHLVHQFSSPKRDHANSRDIVFVYILLTFLLASCLIVYNIM